MTTITIILEDHSSDCAAQFVKANRDLLHSSDFCTEFQHEAGKDCTVPLSSATRAEIIRTSSYQSIRELLKLLPTQPVYPIDTFVSRENAGMYFKYAQQLQLKLNHPFSPFKKIYYEENTILLRDEIMAENIIALLRKNKAEKKVRNLIAVVGAHHYGLVYHLIYKLKTLSLLPEINLNLFNTLNVRLCQNSYHSMEFQPVFHFKQLPVSVVEMHHITEGVFSKIYRFDKVLSLHEKPTQLFSLRQWHYFMQRYEKLMHLLHQQGGLAELFFSSINIIEMMQSKKICRFDSQYHCKTKLLQFMTSQIIVDTPLIGIELFVPGAIQHNLKIEVPLQDLNLAKKCLSRLNVF